jgi:PAS domain S-box-containing protein
MNQNEIKKLVNQLQEQKTEAQNILSKILLPILITSKETRKIVYANPYAEKQYEINLDTLVGMEVSEFYTDGEQRDKIISNIKSDGTVENLEMNFKTHLGKKFIGLLSVTNINFHGEACFMGMVKD